MSVKITEAASEKQKDSGDEQKAKIQWQRAKSKNTAAASEKQRHSGGERKAKTQRP